MAEYTIDKFSYGGNTYNFDKDNFIINVTIDSSKTITSIDKTASEISSAYSNGKNLIAYVYDPYFVNGYSIIPLDNFYSDTDGDYYDFTLNFVNGTSNGYIASISRVAFYFTISNNAIIDSGYLTDALSPSPSTDEKVNVTLNTTSKAYVLGTTTTPTSTAQGVTSVADTGIYLDTTAGRLTATSFSGSGAALTSINASNISSGTIPAARINGAAITTFNASNISTGTVPAERINGAAITSFNASNISTGTIPAARVCGSTLSAINASNLSTGTLPNARLAASGVTAGSYGPSADATPAAGSNFSVPYVTVDTYGRVTAAVTRNITMPSVGAAAAKAVDTSISAGSTSTNLPTSAAVAAYVAAQGGGDCEVFVIHYVWDGVDIDDGDFIETAAEVYEAYTSGKMLVLNVSTDYDSMFYYYWMDNSSDFAFKTVTSVDPDTNTITNDTAHIRLTSSTLQWNGAGSEVAHYGTSNLTVYSGTTAPSTSTGSNGDIYLLLGGSSVGNIAYMATV